MTMCSALVMKYVRALFYTNDSSVLCGSISDKKDMVAVSKIAEDCLCIYEVLRKDNSLLADYIHWNIYEKSVAWLCAELNVCDEVRNLLLVIKINRHCCYLRDILLAVHDEWLRVYGSVHAVYVTSERCDEKEMNEVKRILSDLVNSADDCIRDISVDINKRELDVEFSVDKGILGGFKLIVNDKMYDYSLASMLNRIRAELDSMLNVEYN